MEAVAGNEVLEAAAAGVLTGVKVMGAPTGMSGNLTGFGVAMTGEDGGDGNASSVECCLGRLLQQQQKTDMAESIREGYMG